MPYKARINAEQFGLLFFHPTLLSMMGKTKNKNAITVHLI
jgi:hypothetical protein